MITTKRASAPIGVVGPCSAGKSTLVAQLSEHQIHARHIAQEHSHVKTMWQRLSNPDILIFLDVSYPVAQKRRKLNWNEDEYILQQERLQHAREHADLYLMTDGMTPDDVLEKVLVYLKGY